MGHWGQIPSPLQPLVTPPLIGGGASTGVEMKWNSLYAILSHLHWARGQHRGRDRVQLQQVYLPGAHRRVQYQECVATSGWVSKVLETCGGVEYVLWSLLQVVTTIYDAPSPLCVKESGCKPSACGPKQSKKQLQQQWWNQLQLLLLQTLQQPATAAAAIAKPPDAEAAAQQQPQQHQKEEHEHC